ncbi:MAG: hypothetical protein M1837_002984 [Sclerophora amabilis]|nr:MAG: hypothetical protein M1837_002984 [Sclerophora amabilis]
MGKLSQFVLDNWGRKIYVYTNIRTSQTVYSLTPLLENKKALKQIPYLGKKTVPASLRKDLWHPLASLSFPHPQQGLHAFRQLREFKRLHELAWNKEDFKSSKNPGVMMSKKERGKKLMNQKANSIADMAAVLKLQERAGKEPSVAEPESEADVRPTTPRLSRRKGSRSKVQERFKVEGVDGVTISWSNLLDAEFAESWPDGVIHDGLKPSRHRMPREELIGTEMKQPPADV